MESMESVRG